MDKSNKEIKSSTQVEAGNINSTEKEGKVKEEVEDKGKGKEVKGEVAKEVKSTQSKSSKSKNTKGKNIRVKKKLKRMINKKIYIRAMSFIVMSLFLFGASISRAGAISISDNKISLNSNNDNEYTDNDRSDNKEKDEKDTESPDKKNNSNDSKEENDKSETKYKNTSEEGQKYIYDAVEVSKKLKNGDYKNSGKKIVFLTFDDGASNTVTPKILKTLDDYSVKATFFIMGQVLEDGGENAKKLVKEEYDKGHAIANHSYCHDYNVLYPGRHLDLEAFKNDYNKNAEELKSILGDDFSTRVIRCPGGYMSWKDMDQLDGYLEENNMASIDWSALSGDAEGGKKDASQLLKYAVESSENQEMVVMLMHDTYGKEETAKSLPKIIEYFKGHGYEFRTLG
ncbi:MAG: polysaccharide deacetylase family protein [Clostridium sp.]|nr:polysaccharide deacetylase family protein [Clostridium sp.]